MISARLMAAMHPRHMVPRTTPPARPTRKLETLETLDTLETPEKKLGGQPPRTPPMPRRFQISQKVVFAYLVTIEKHLVLHAYLIFSSMYTTMIISILTESKNGPRAPNQH